ncbi:hypothetical protein SDC9_101877 [bioreactor metagenome]|uniref:Uncharacterized protein n=1 Tax=bioreactor metagenome TaxID=1076179 RepID=A0A645APB4_9ZZZZ
MFQILPQNTAKSIPFEKGQLKLGTDKLLDQDEWIVRIDESFFRWFIQNVFRVLTQELVQRVGRCDQNRHRFVHFTAGAAGLLQCRGDGAGVPRHNDLIHATNIHAQFKRVCGDGQGDLAGFQTMLDLSAVRLEISATVATDDLSLPGVERSQVMNS